MEDCGTETSHDNIKEPEYVENNDFKSAEAGTVGCEDSDLQSEIIAEMIDLIPSVTKALAVEGHDKDMLDFFKLVRDSNFPLKNISFQLWLEVVKWFSCGSTTEMRYSDSTKKFWKLGYRLFGGQFIYFMSGYKNRITVVMEDTEKGIYPPSQSDINFAVPSKDVLTTFSPYGLDASSEVGLGRRPGLLTDMIETLAESPSENSYCLTFDGKKLKRGLTKSSGDVDLLGFEPGLSLSERKKQATDVKKPIQDLIKNLSDKDESQNMGTDLTETEREELAEILTTHMKIVSLNILNAREFRKKKEYAKEKLIERSGGSDWKNGKYVLAISSMIAYIHDIDEFLKESLMIVDELNKCVCCLKQSSKVISQDEMNLVKSDDYREIELSENPGTRNIKQRSSEWFNLRSKAQITGSTVYAALGLDGLAKQKEHFDVKIGGLHEKAKPENVKSAMAYGTENEINAAATVLGKVIPMLCPGQKMYEEGCIEIDSKNAKSFMIVSPDGSVRSADGEESTTMAIELKCPVFDV